MLLPIFGEECDDGDGIDANACLNNCAIAVCGDGVRRTDIFPGNPGFESCDDANNENKDACANGCRCFLRRWYYQKC